MAGTRAVSILVQRISEPEIYHGAGFLLLADERVRMKEPLQICLDAEAAKLMTSNLPLLSVLGTVVFNDQPKSPVMSDLSLGILFLIICQTSSASIPK